MDLSMTRGDTLLVDIDVTNRDGSVRDLTDASLKMTAKTSRFDSDDDAVFQVDAGPLDAMGGTAVITVAPSHTSGLTNFAVLVYDVQLTEASGQVTTLQAGKLTVELDATIS
jgi:hypothetical protein